MNARTYEEPMDFPNSLAILQTLLQPLKSPNLTNKLLKHGDLRKHHEKNRLHKRNKK